MAAPVHPMMHLPFRDDLDDEGNAITDLRHAFVEWPNSAPSVSIVSRIVTPINLDDVDKLERKLATPNEEREYLKQFEGHYKAESERLPNGMGNAEGIAMKLLSFGAATRLMVFFAATLLSSSVCRCPNNVRI